MFRYTRKHYIDVAKVIYSLPLDCRIMTSERFCHLFIDDGNPSFNVDRFVNACGLKDEVTIIKEP